MDGAKFDINIEAKTLGVDSSAEQLNAFAQRIQQVDTVATQLDSVVAAASKRFEEAAAAAKLAADALGTAEKRYRELESAANSAAKQVEKASAAGKDTTALAAAAAKAKAAMAEQAKAVDALREKSLAAAAAQSKLGETLKTLQGKQKTASAEITKAKPAMEGSGLSAMKFGAVAGLAAKGADKMSAALGDAETAVVGWIKAANPAAVMRFTRATDRMELGLKRIFVGLKLDKFMTGLEDIMTLFDQGTSSANGLKTIVETVFQPLLDGSGKIAPLVKEMFKGMIYGALLVVAAVLRIRNAIFASMSPETRKSIKAVIDSVFSLQNAFSAGVGVAVLLTAAAIVLTVSLVAMAIAELAALWPILLVVAGVAALIAVFMYWGAITKWVSKQWADFKEGLALIWHDLVEGAKNVAADMINGMVSGITKGAKWVYDAVKNLGKGAVGMLKGVLGIGSPSKVFALQGVFSGQGFAEGVEDSTPLVHGALESMASPADLGPGVAPPSGAGAASSTSTSSASSRTIHIAQLTIGDTPVAQSTFGDLKRTLLEVLEGASLTIGGGEAPAP